MIFLIQYYDFSRIFLFRDQNKLFSECFESLKDQGELIIFEPTFREVHQAPHDYIRYTPYGIKQIFEDFTPST